MKQVLLTGLAILPILLVANPTHASGGGPWGYTVNLGFSFGLSPGYQFGHGYGSGFGYGYAGPPNFGGAGAYYNGPLYNYGYGPYNQAMLGAGYPYPLGGAEAFYNGFGHGNGYTDGGCANGQCLPSFPRLFHRGHGLFSRLHGLFHHKHGCEHHHLPVGTSTFGSVPVAGGEVIGGCSGCGNGTVISSSQYTPNPATNPTPTTTPYINPLVMPLAPAAHQFPAPQQGSSQAGFSFGR